MNIPKIAEYFDSNKFESSASKIWSIDQILSKSNWKTSLYFVPESDITHFNFFFELKKLSLNNFKIFVTREQSLIQSDLECTQKNAKLMIQLLLIKGDEQVNVQSKVFCFVKIYHYFINTFVFEEFIVNLFETDRLKYNQFQKVIEIEKDLFLASKVNDSLKIRIGVKLKN